MKGTRHSEEQIIAIRREAWRAWWLNCPTVIGQKLGNSCCFQYDHRYSTGFSSGAYAGRNSSHKRPRCCCTKSHTARLR